MVLSLDRASTTLLELLGLSPPLRFFLGREEMATSSVDFISFSYTDSMLSELISSEDRDWNLLKTSTANCLERVWLKETSFQSMVFIGLGLACLDVLRLSLTLAETTLWSDPTELKD